MNMKNALITVTFFNVSDVSYYVWETENGSG